MLELTHYETEERNIKIPSSLSRREKNKSQPALIRTTKLTRDINKGIQIYSKKSRCCEA